MTTEMSRRSTITVYRTPLGASLDHSCAGPCATCDSAIALTVDVAAVVEDGVLVGLDCTASGWPIALGAEESAEAMDLALERLERELEQAYRDMEDQ